MSSFRARKNQAVAIEIIDAIMLIYKLTSSPPMSEAPKYDFRSSNIGNFADNVQGDQKAVQHNYAQEQNLTEAAKEIQQLLEQLKQDNPTPTEEELIKQDSRLRQILVAGGIELVKILWPIAGIPIEIGRKCLETAKQN